MNVFTSDKAPAVLALFVAVIGFFVTNVMDEMRSGSTLVYSLAHSKNSNKSTISLHNVSRDRSITGMGFQIFCENAQPDCFYELDGKYYRTPLSGFKIKDNAYIRTFFDEQTASDAMISGNLSLAPGSKIKIELFLSKRFRKSLIFLATPQQSQSVLLLPRNSLQGRFIVNYVDVMTSAFLIASFLLLLLICWAPIKSLIDPKLGD